MNDTCAGESNEDGPIPPHNHPKQDAIYADCPRCNRALRPKQETQRERETREMTEEFGDGYWWLDEDGEWEWVVFEEGD